MEEQDQGQQTNNVLNKILVLGVVFSALFIVFTLVYIFKPAKGEDEVAFEETRESEISLDKPGEAEEEPEEDTDSTHTAPEFTVNENEDEEVEEESEEETVEEDLYADLYIHEYTFVDDPVQNEEFTVRIEIGNSGDKTAKDFRWEWWATEDDRACDDEVDEIEPGDKETVECSYTYEDVDDYETRVVVDSDDDIDESDEDNNELVEEVTPEPEQKADLVISEYSFDPVPEKAVPFTVRIGIKNQGNIAAGPFWWEWWGTHANYACREQISTLAPNSEKVVTCDYTYGGWSTYDTKAVADVDDDVEESDETNNEYHEDVVPIH